MKQPMISILIPNYNGKHFLVNCLPSIFNNSYKNFEVIVIDNNSSDDSVSFLRQKFTQVKLVINDDNLGYSQGMNIGAKYAQGDYFLFLDYDTTVDKYWLEKLVQVISRDLTIGLCTSQIIDNTGNSQHYVHGGVIDKYGFFAPRASNALNKKDKIEKINYGITSWIVSREAFFAAGMFDPNYRYFCDDTDLSWRIQLAGYKAFYVPTSIVYHYKIKKDSQKTSWRLLCKKRFIYERDYLITILKNLQSKSLVKSLPLYFLYKFIIFPLNLIAFDFTFLFGLLGIITALLRYPRQKKLFHNREISDRELFKDSQFKLSPLKLRVSPIILNNPFKKI